MAALAANNHPSVSKMQHDESGISSKSPTGSTSHMDQSPSLSNSQNFDLLSGSYLESPIQDIPGSGTLEVGPDDSPFLDFDLDEDYDLTGELIGDLPDPADLGEESESREKRKSIDGEPEELDNLKKRRESDGDKIAKKPGRKPLTSEPTSVR